MRNLGSTNFSMAKLWGAATVLYVVWHYEIRILWLECDFKIVAEFVASGINGVSSSLLVHS